jgi:hypothetical protein
MNRLASYGIAAIALSAILTQAAPALGQTSTTTGPKKPADETIKGYTVEKKSEAVAYGRKLMSDLDVQIKDLEKRVASDTSAAAADAKRQGKDIKELAAPRLVFGGPPASADGPPSLGLRPYARASPPSG